MHIKFLATVWAICLVGTSWACGLFFIEIKSGELNNFEKSFSVTGNLCRIMSTIANSSKTIILPQQCVECEGTFDLEGYKFEVSVHTNLISAATHDWLSLEKLKGRRYRSIGKYEGKISITREDGELWDVCLYAETCHEDAKEIAVRSFFGMSSMMPDAIASSIEMCTEQVGDYCLSWKSYEARKNFLVFVKGGFVIIVRGRSSVAHIAKLIDRILDECMHSKEKGCAISFVTAGIQLSKSRLQGN